MFCERFLLLAILMKKIESPEFVTENLDWDD